MHRHGARVAGINIAPHLLQELLRREQVTAIAHEEREQLELARLESHGALAQRDSMRRHVQLQITADQPLGGRWRLGQLATNQLTPPQHGLHASEQLARGKRLGQIIVRAHLETDDAVDLLRARGQHQNRNSGIGTDATAYFESVHARQHHVKNHNIWPLVSRHRDGLIARGGHDHVIASLLKVVAQRVQQIRFVVYDEHPGHSGLLNRSQCVHPTHTVITFS
jgi:hypothetical protein